MRVKVDLKTAASDAMVAFAAKLAPHMATRVTEGRQEITTEGYLDVAAPESPRQSQVNNHPFSGIASHSSLDGLPNQHRRSSGRPVRPLLGSAPQLLEKFSQVNRRPDRRGQVEAKSLADAAGRIVVAMNGPALTFDDVQPVAAFLKFCETHAGRPLAGRGMMARFRQTVTEMNTLARSAGLSL